jgi:FkbM family methyltransferase
LGVTLETRKRPSSDLDVFAQIYSYHEYQPLVQLFNKHFPQSQSMNIIDAGSNIGLTTVFLSKHYPNAQFIAVEPDSDNFERMAANFKHNQINQVEKVKGGVWSQNAYLKIISDFRYKNHWSIRVEETQDASELPAFSINHLIANAQWNSIDILKIDIEGSEKEVFESNYESWLPSTKSIVIELHDQMKKGCSRSVFAAISKYNFRKNKSH